MSEQIRTDILIAGGGAAGFFAAIQCATHNPKLKIILLERGRKPLEKVRISGGGRCNVTHACFTPKELSKFYPRGEKALLGPFTRFCTGDTMEWFEQRGVALKIEADNRIFPVSDDSQTIINCLWQELKKHGIEIRTQYNLTALHPPAEKSGQWVIETNKAVFVARKVMMATGSNPRVWDMLGQLGHSIIPPVPSLFTFNIQDPRIEGLAGLSVEEAYVSISKTRLEATGPLLITHWGMSGPGILRISAWGARTLHDLDYQFELKVNWLQGWYRQWPEQFSPVGKSVDFDTVRKVLLSLKQTHGRKQIQATALPGLPNRLWKRLCEAASIPSALRWADAGKKQINRLVSELTAGSFRVNGKSTFKEEFVTAGGVQLKEVNFKRFESKLFPNLFFAGEVLNIDAITGGFNFQAAWTGGWIAGQAMSGYD